MLPAVTSHSEYDRLLLGSPLRRPVACIAIGAVLVVVLGLATLIQLALLASMRADVAAVFYRALALSSLLATVPLAILWFLDRRERENPWLFAAALFWGACIATALAFPFNTAFFQVADAWVREHPAVAAALGPEAATLLAAPLSAPLVEETAKALGVLALWWLLRAEFDNMRDGLVYGALVGLGFELTENVRYLTLAAVQAGIAGLARGVWVRGILGGLKHAVFTATVGAGIGSARHLRDRRARVLVPALAFGAALVQHAAWNGIASSAITRALCGAPDVSSACLVAPTQATLFVRVPVVVACFLAPGALLLLVLARGAARSTSL